MNTNGKTKEEKEYVEEGEPSENHQILDDGETTRYREVSIEVPTTIKVPVEDTRTASPAESPVAALKRYLDQLPQHPSFKAEIQSVSVWREIRCEVFASFFLTLFTAASSLRPSINTTLTPPRTLSSAHDDYYLNEVNGQDPPNSEWEIQWSLGHGLAMGALSWAIRTAHFSLPTSVGLFITRKISLLKLGLHFFAQLFGSLAAVPILYGLLSRPPRAPILGASVSPIQGWGIEFFASLLITLVSLSSYCAPSTLTRCSTSERTVVDENFTPRIAYGALLPLIAAHITAALFTVGITGIGLNPTRSLSVAVLTGQLNNSHWVWWLGPTLGGVLAAFTHEYTGARNSKSVHDVGVTPRPSIVPKEAVRHSFLSTSVPTSPT